MAEPLAGNDNILRNAIVIDYGMVSGSTDAALIGKELFFVSWADQDGFELCLDDTPYCLVAIRLAQTAASDFMVTNIIERFRSHRGEGGEK